MKQVLLISLAFIAFAFITPPNTLTGRWQQTFNANTTLLVFRADNTFDVFLNGKAFTNGKYFVRQDTLAINDISCNLAYFGTYKLDFFAPDSVRFVTIADSCRGRNGDLHNWTIGRVTAATAKPSHP